MLVISVVNIIVVVILYALVRVNSIVGSESWSRCTRATIKCQSQYFGCILGEKLFPANQLPTPSALCPSIL